MKDLEALIKEVEQSRKDFIAALEGLTSSQADFKPDPKAWSIQEITEHMVWAERAGVFGMWKAFEGKRNGNPIWEGENQNRGLSIEEVIARTWKEKEEVPTVAKPRWGGPINYWIAALESCSITLLRLSEMLGNVELESIIYPHPISGPLDVNQRMQFLRFHMQRHQLQIERVKSHPDFPRKEI